MKRQGSSSSSKRRYMDRRVDTREQIPTFLIVCEGERTETLYFIAFKLPSATVIGTGFNTDTLVEEAIRLRSKGDYDQVWCVFDKDEFPPERFNRAFILAKREGISVAYSHEAFELWFYLHFHYIDSGITRQEYINKLSDLLPKKYDKCSDTMYTDLLPLQNIAILNATNLLRKYSSSIPIECNPSTTVHLLVLELNKYTRTARYA